MATELDYDRSLHDKEHEAGPFEVTESQIKAFSRGIAETNPIYTDPAAQTLTETRAAANAVLTVNGIENIQRSSNTIDDLVEGITFTLKDADPTVTVSVTSSKNFSGLTKKLDSFVKSYNTLIDSLAEQTAYNGEGAASGILLGDSTVSRIGASLSSMIYQGVDGVDSAVNSLSRLGMEIDDTGHLSLDKSKVTSAMESNPDDVIKFFTGNTR